MAAAATTTNAPRTIALAARMSDHNYDDEEHVEDTASGVQTTSSSRCSSDDDCVEDDQARCAQGEYIPVLDDATVQNVPLMTAAQARCAVNTCSGGHNYNSNVLQPLRGR